MGVKLCECGCGKPAPLAGATNIKRGWIKGEPIRFIKFHHQRRSTPTIKSVHWECRLLYPAPLGPCEECGEPAVDRHHKAYPSNARQDIAFLCRRCHMKIDGRGERQAATMRAARKPVLPTAPEWKRV